MKLTKAQRSMLEELAGVPDSALVVETIREATYTEIPTFRGSFIGGSCRTCRQPINVERVYARLVFALEEKDLIKERLKRSGWFSEITPAGRAALAAYAAREGKQ